MKHTTAHITVYESTDYNRFGMIKGNRELDMNKIKKILADIDRGTNLLKYCPILVVDKDGKLDIVDGQHRFMVSKKVKSPVYYILAEDLSLYDIARMNSNTEKWKARDFINCYMQLGNEHYKKLDAFLKTYSRLPVTSAINLLATGRVHSHRQTEKFQRGEFTAKYQREAETLCETINRFQFENRFSRDFMMAIAKVIESDIYPVDQLVEKVNADPDQLKMHNHWRKYLVNLEEIANKGKQKRVAIY